MIAHCLFYYYNARGRRDYASRMKGQKYYKIVVSCSDMRQTSAYKSNHEVSLCLPIKMNNLTKKNKSVGFFQFAGASSNYKKKDGTLHKHGHGGGNEHPCPGSYKLHNSTVLSSDQSQQRADSHQTKINREARAAPPSSNIYDASGSHIELPQ